jgi:hypothetical protein
MAIQEHVLAGMSIRLWGFSSILFDLKSTPGTGSGSAFLGGFAVSVAIIYNYVNKKQARRDAFGVCSWRV